MTEYKSDSFIINDLHRNAEADEEIYLDEMSDDEELERYIEQQRIEYRKDWFEYIDEDNF